MLLHGETVGERGEEARDIGGRLDQGEHLRVGSLFDESSEASFTVEVMPAQRVQQCGVAGSFRPSVDPHQVVIAGSGRQPLCHDADEGRRRQRVAVSIRRGRHLFGRSAIEGRCNQLVAVAEIVAEQPMGDSDVGGDIAERHGCEALPCDKTDGGVEDLLSPEVGALSFTGSAR